MTVGPTRVVIADDHTMFREGLARALTLRGGMEVVGQTTNDERVVDLATQVKPDVVIMQVQLPLERAKRTLSELLKISPPPKVIFVSMLESPRDVRDLLRLGASAYLTKSASIEQLISSIRTAVLDQGNEPIVVGMPEELLERAAEEESPLTEREMEVLLLAARGLTNHEIGSRLYVSETTVKRHLANIYQKMGVTSRREAARKALKEGWITIGEITD